MKDSTVFVLNSMGNMTFYYTPGFKNVRMSGMSQEQTCELMNSCAGNAILVLEGGADIHPKWYGAELKPYTSFIPWRDAHEIMLYHTARQLGIPIIGICRGHQLVCALEGGTLFQDLAIERGRSHRSTHGIKHTEWSEACGFLDLMQSCPSGSPFIVNSMHHQGVDRVPENAKVLAVAEDGLVEALWYEFGITVQWHPEFLGHTEVLKYVRDTFLQVNNDNRKYADGNRDRGSESLTPSNGVTTDTKA